MKSGKTCKIADRVGEEVGLKKNVQYMCNYANTYEQRNGFNKNSAT
jgi:hypothetical protein